MYVYMYTEEQYNTLATSKGLGLSSEPDGLDSSRNPIKQLLVEIVESILVHDRKVEGLIERIQLNSNYCYCITYLTN